MSTKPHTLALAALFAPLLLGACATTAKTVPAGTATAAETIAWSVGPCFGFCPVYTAAVTPNGTVTFDGVRHTATLGHQVGHRTPAAYRAAAAALADYRPATGTTGQTICEQRISDQATTRISWTAADGTVTTLEHARGCRSPQNDALNAALERLPTLLGIADWTRQTTRPGASRG